MSLRRVLKSLATGAFLVLVFPCALASGFGRLETVFSLFAQACALVPGIMGNYVRVAYYRMTLRSCARDFYIEFGSFFAHPQTTVGRHVGVGPYCIIGYAVIGEGTLIGPGAKILSGGQQHKRDSEGRLTDEGRRFKEIVIGEHCWIGALAVVLADIGHRSTVAAGAVVLTPVAPGVVVGGNPAEKWWPPNATAQAATAGRSS
jgi:virginiamycin A acetyltransferase